MKKNARSKTDCLVDWANPRPQERHDRPANRAGGSDTDGPMVCADGQRPVHDTPPELTPNQQKVYEYLCEIEGQEVPGDRPLARQTGVKASTAKSAIIALERKGLIVIENDRKVRRKDPQTGQFLEMDKGIVRLP